MRRSLGVSLRVTTKHLKWSVDVRKGENSADQRCFGIVGEPCIACQFLSGVIMRIWMQDRECASYGQ